MTALLLSLLLGSANAADSALEIGGYVAPHFRAVMRPAARPLDQKRIGMVSSKAGLMFAGQVAPAWNFNIHLIVGGDTFAALTSASPVDVNNDGTTDGIYTESRAAISNIVEESTVTFRPVEQFNVRVGRMRIPFTSQAQSPNTALMFPERSGPNEVFLAGTDLGGLLETQLFDGRILGSAGAFNGTSSGQLQSNRRGVLYTTRLDLNPLGSFGFSETSEWQGPFRVGVGAGLVHNPYTAYDFAGYPIVSVHDTRYTGSARIAFYGLYVVGEYLQRTQQDSLSGRPEWASGWYGQAGWHLPLGLEPMARMGEARADESFDTRKTVWIDAGLNFYPAQKAGRSDQVKITTHYLSENRVTEGEHAQGIASQVQVRW